MGRVVTHTRSAPDYDFQRPYQLAPDALDLARSFAQRWAHRMVSESNTKLIGLSSPIDVQLNHVTTNLYGDWTLDCPRPAVLNVLDGPARGLVMVDATLAPRLLDHVLSGDGRWTRMPKELSTIETALWRHYMTNWLDPFNFLWPREMGVQWSLKAIESQPAFLNLLQEIDWVVIADYTMVVDDQPGRVTWLWELKSFAQILAQAATRMGPQIRSEADLGTAPRRQLTDVAIPAHITLGDLPWNLALLEDLKPGSLITFSIPAGDVLPLQVADQVIGYGRLGQIRSRYAVEITRMMDRASSAIPGSPMGSQAANDAESEEPNIEPGRLSVDV